MAKNKRVILVADLIETVEKHNCKIPDDAIITILNDKHNAGVFKTQPDYKNTTQTVMAARELIDKRKKSKKELYL